jgi:hypothetical protein
MNPKSKSKHHQKSKGVAPVRVQSGPVFSYTSKCCAVQAIKPPCAFVGLKSKEAETQGLGGFRCSGCKKPCKCSRHKNENLSGTQLKIPLDKAPIPVV